MKYVEAKSVEKYNINKNISFWYSHAVNTNGIKKYARTLVYEIETSDYAWFLVLIRSKKEAFAQWVHKCSNDLVRLNPVYRYLSTIFTHQSAKNVLSKDEIGNGQLLLDMVDP